MEILEQEIEKNIEEKPIDMNLTKTLLSKIKKDDYTDFLVIILKPKYSMDYSKLEMFGITGLDYILNSVQDYEIKQVDYDLNDDLIKIVKQNLNDKKYVLVLFSDTPLLKKSTIHNILDYFLLKSLCALKVNRGYVFDSSYLKSVDKIYNPQEQNFEEEDFIKVDSSRSFSYALDILKNRIIGYHQNNGVIIQNINNTYIDAVVNIEKGAILGNNVTLKGKSIIKENCFIENSVINRAILENNVIVENSILENTIVKKNAKIIDFSVVKNSSVKENSVLVNEKII